MLYHLENCSSNRLKWWFLFSIGALVKISTGALVATTVTAEIGDVFLDTEIYDKQAGTLSLLITGAFVTTIGTAAIGDVIYVTICAT